MSMPAEATSKYLLHGFEVMEKVLVSLRELIICSYELHRGRLCRHRHHSRDRLVLSCLN